MKKGVEKVKEKPSRSIRPTQVRAKPIGKAIKSVIVWIDFPADMKYLLVHLVSLVPDVEIQAGRCVLPRYNRFFKCSGCVGKVSGYKCAFENWRMFRLSPGTNKIVGVPFFDDCPPAALNPPKFPSAADFNRTPTPADSFYLQVSACCAWIVFSDRSTQYMLLWFYSLANCRTMVATGVCSRGSARSSEWCYI
jgi:hypothetical protein